MTSAEHTRRIAHNTLLLYGRMIVTTLVSLYASRQVLLVLGIDDNNTYALVGSFVAMFSFLNTAMASATQKFLNIERTRKVFSTSIEIHTAIAIVFLILGETVGLWFVHNELVIPSERIDAALWAYHFAILTACLNIVRVPYNAMIVAAERMSMYAFLTIAEAVLRLGAVLILTLLAGDKLVLFGALSCGVVGLVTLIFGWYCRREFRECRYERPRDRELMRRMIGFSGWSLLGSGANVAANHGVSLLFNIVVRGGALNVAMEKASQIGNAAYALVLNFQTAFTPRMMKSWAKGEDEYFKYLIFRASKYSYFLLFLITLPFGICADELVELWFAPMPPPEHTANFARLLMCFLLIDALSGPLWSAVQATGRIRNYQITMSAIMLSSLPLAWIVIHAGCAPEMALAVRVFINIICFGVRLGYLGRNMAFPVGRYLCDVVLRIVGVTMLSLPVAWFFDGWAGAGISVAVCLAAIFFVGMERTERRFLLELRIKN